MSGKGGRTGGRIDLRARRTRVALAEALIRLAPEKGYSAVGVDDLARGAAVSRSTFYAHYADKADFLDRSYAEMARRANEASWASGAGPLLPVRAVFSHMREAKDFARAMHECGALDQLLARREDVLREIAEANLARRGASGGRRTAVMLAGAYMALVRWWIGNGFEPAPEEMQAWFNRFADAAAGPSAGTSALKLSSTSSTAPERSCHEWRAD